MFNQEACRKSQQSFEKNPLEIRRQTEKAQSFNETCLCHFLQIDVAIVYEFDLNKDIKFQM